MAPLDPVTEYLAAKKALVARSVDVKAIEAGDQAAIAANRAGDRAAEARHQQEALKAAASLLDQSFSEEIAKLAKAAKGAEASQAKALATEAGQLSKAGRLGSALEKYQQALKLLGGG